MPPVPTSRSMVVCTWADAGLTNPFLRYVASFEQLLDSGRGLDAASAPSPELPPLAQGAPVCLVCSPHPDDEAIAGGLPWRLRSQSGWRVVNVAVTLGSNQGRRAARWNELLACCAYLGFELVSASGESHTGLERITPQTAQQDAAYWAACVARVADLITHYQPRLIVCPHQNDGHAAHTGTHLLVMDALRRLGPGVQAHLALSEYWNTQPDPGLMVELGPSDVATLMAALSQHVGEVARNPYHLTLPAFLMDGVRRGAERVGAPGSAAPQFSFAALYGWRRWAQGQSLPLPAQVLALHRLPATLFG